MTRARLFAAASLAGAAALIGTVSASAAVRPSPAAHTAGAAKAAMHTHAVPVPPGARPVRPPRPGTGLRHLASRLPADISGDTIGCSDQNSFRSTANLLWVSAELGDAGNDYGMLRARNGTIGAWEQFAFCFDYTNSFWFIESDANGLYVSAELGDAGNQNGMLRARASSVGSWEQYTLFCTASDTLVIGSDANSLYVSAELGDAGNDYGMLRARASSVGPWEQFQTSNSLTGTTGC